MRATALVYSSHDRCNYIHNDWIVQRALQGNRQIMHLPMSMGPQHSQEYGWGNFRWYFDFYRDLGLEAFPFFWNDGLRKEDVDKLMHWLWHAEVVILGGGNPTLGLQRYKALGEWYYGEPGMFGRILHERQDRGLLTVGFSAGVDQLCEYMSSGIEFDIPDMDGFGLCRNIMALSHFEHGHADHTLWEGASGFPHCMVFGLPNDSGLAVDQGWLPSGNVWQIIHVITDNSWDNPRDGFHIKTRQGVKVQHTYPDGRRWGFNGGDTIVRIQSPDNSFTDAFILSAQGGPIIHYWNQQPTGYSSIGEILGNH